MEEQSPHTAERRLAVAGVRRADVGLTTRETKNTAVVDAIVVWLRALGAEDARRERRPEQKPSSSNSEFSQSSELRREVSIHQGSVSSTREPDASTVLFNSAGAHVPRLGTHPRNRGSLGRCSGRG